MSMKSKKHSKIYNRIHYWLRSRFGKANQCEIESCDGSSKNFEWMLKAGKRYTFDRNNYMMACRKCHVRYDWNIDRTNDLVARSHTKLANEKRSKTLKGIKKPTGFGEMVRKVQSVPIIGIDNNGNKKEFTSLTKAAQILGVTCNAIWLTLRGYNKHCKGYIFKYKDYEKNKYFNQKKG